MTAKKGNRRCYWCLGWIEKDEPRLVTRAARFQRFCTLECLQECYGLRGFPDVAITINTLDDE